MEEANIVNFIGQPVRLVSDYDGWKLYGFEVNRSKYKNLKFNSYGNLSVVGDIPKLSLYTDYYVEAEESKHPKYNWQYKIKKIYRDQPSSLEDTRKFLNEVLTQEQSEELLKNYPDIIDRVINNKEVDLSKLYNIKEKRFAVIKRKIIENFGLIKLVNKFGKYGISFEIIKKIYSDFESLDDIIVNLRNRPYELLCKIPQVGFRKADSILLKIPKDEIGWTEDLLISSMRMKACINYLLEQQMFEGNTKYYISKIKLEAEKLTPECFNKFDESIKDKKYILDDKFIGLKENYDIEQNIANFCSQALKDSFILDENIEYEKYRDIDEIKLSDEQLNTLKLINKYNMVILTAGAGCGKSSSSKAVINLLKDLNKSFVIASPTGKAAKIISEYTGEPAFTIHKLLGLPFCQYSKDSPLPYEFIIIDEFSMADIFLTNTLFDCIDSAKTKILIIADNYQLPSVGAGNVLHDMLESKKIPTNRLTKIFRYDEGGLMQVATKIRKSESYIKDGVKGQVWFGENKDYCFVGIQQTQIIDYIKKIYKNYLDCDKSIEDIIVLSSYNKGDYGTIKINEELQKVIHGNNAKKDKKHIEYGDKIFYINDLVIQTHNNYKLKLYDNCVFTEAPNKKAIFNGEVGKIIDIIPSGLVVQFDNELIFYDRSDMIDLSLAYSISSHRSQGSSFKNVIMVTPKAHTYMLNSNLMYVGCTRAKQKVIHIGDSSVVNKTIKKKANWDRKTYLKQLLTL